MRPAARVIPTVAVALVRETDDAALVERIRSGDEGAFEALFRRYFLPLHDYIVLYVKSSEAAKECTQDVMLAMWERREQLRIRESVRHYLYQAARNHALNYLRRERIVARWADRAAHDLALSGMGQGPESSDDRLERRDLHAVLRATVANLPPRQREALLLRLDHHLPNAEIAKVMGISIKMVEVHLMHALRTLRQALNP